MLSSWTVQSFDIRAQERFAAALTNFLPTSNLMISIEHVHSGSVTFDTTVDVIDGNKTAADALATTLQVGCPHPQPRLRSWSCHGFTQCSLSECDAVSDGIDIRTANSRES